MNYAHIPDETLLYLIKQQDSQAFENLYDRHSQIIHNLVIRIVNDHAFADEIVQETFWQVWLKAKDFRGTGAAAAWLYRIARNKSLDVVRKQKRKPQIDSSYQSEEKDEQSSAQPLLSGGSAATTSLVEVQVGQHLDQQQLQQALASIPSEQRACLELAYFEGFSQSQISGQLGVPLGTVKTRVRMGLEKLEHILRAAGYREDDFRL